MTDNKVDSETTRALIERQLTGWRQQFEDFRIAVIVADTVEDATESLRLQGEMKKIVKRIEKLVAMRDELPKPNVPIAS